MNMNLEQWQEMLDRDFPNALTCHKVGTEESFRATCLTPYGFEDGNVKLMFFALDLDGVDVRLVFWPDSYQQVQTDPVPVFQIECTDGAQWTFANSIPAEISDQWKAQKEHDRSIASRGGV